MPEQTTTYEFGPRETGSSIGPLTNRQLIVAGTTMALVFITFRTVNGFPSIGLAAAIGIFAFFISVIPIRGRTTIDWADIVIRFAWRAKLGLNAYRSDAHLQGHRAVLETGEVESPISLPSALESVQMLGVPAPGGGEAGVAFDTNTGVYTATLVVTATEFALLDREDQEGKLAGWGGVLADLARDDSPVSRISWVERTLPSNSDEMIDYFHAHRDESIPLDSVGMRSYMALQAQAAAVQQDHELLITLSIDKGSKASRKRAGRLGKGHEGFCQLLMREINALSRALASAQIHVVGLLTPRALALKIRETVDPFTRVAHFDEDGDFGVSPGQMGPITAEASWDMYEADGTMSVTYWISEWPRIGVGPTFLSPLILNTTVTRAIAVTMDPVPPLTAMRKAEAQATAQESDELARQKSGRRTGALSVRKRQATHKREAELANGHAEIRFAGFITVYGRNEKELDSSCAQIEHAASQARLALTRLSGEQDRAITYTMPLARGLASPVL